MWLSGNSGLSVYRFMAMKGDEHPAYASHGVWQYQTAVNQF